MNKNTGMFSMVRTADAVPARTYDQQGSGALEQRVGAPRFGLPWPRVISPEDSNADFAKWDADAWNGIADGQLPPIIPISGDYTLLRADYNVLANNQYLRAAADVIGAIGRNDQTDYALTTSGGGIFTASSFSSPNLILGFQVEWGLPALNAPMFNMTITTTGFYAEENAGHSVDRSVTLRIDGNQMSGGILACVFAARQTSSNPYASAVGGMNKAIVTPARCQSATSPTVIVTVQSNVATNFSGQVHLLSAASPYLASVRDVINGNNGNY